MASLKQKLEQAATKLVEAKSALADAQRDFDSIYRQIASSSRQRKTDSGSGSETENVTDQDCGQNTTNQILSVLKLVPTKEWGYDEISSRVPGTPRASIRVILYKLQKDGQAMKAGRGKWKAAL
jgi:hypothetical protein